MEEGSVMIEVGRVGQQEPFMFGFDNNEPVPWNYLGLASWDPDVIAYYTNVRTGEPWGCPLLPRGRPLPDLHCGGGCSRGQCGKPHYHAAGAGKRQG